MKGKTYILSLFKYLFFNFLPAEFMLNVYVKNDTAHLIVYT